MPEKPAPRKRHWIKERMSFERERDFSKFYNARKWRKFAKLFKSKNSYCVMCKAEGFEGPAQVTDHIRGLGFLIDNGLDPYSEKECQSLCNKHHNKKSGSEAHK